MTSFAAKFPNILITGTPGTGKTQTASLASEKIGFKHINVGEYIKKYECHDGKDEEFDSFVVDDDKILDILEPILEEGGCIVDFHSIELFPESWFDLILVLRAETSVLYDRLSERGYSDKKRSENIECEIMQICLEEARESFPEEIVHELQSNSLDDLDNNIGRVQAWLDAWKANNT